MTALIYKILKPFDKAKSTHFSWTIKNHVLDHSSAKEESLKEKIIFFFHDP